MIHGLPDDWSDTDEGHAAVYITDPEAVRMSHAARVIYELRLDVARLNDEAIELNALASRLLNESAR